MNDNEKIQSFGDMVDATERLTKPWRWALLITNALWALVVILLISYAYLVPAEMTQEQDFPAQQQTQTYSEGAATHGG